MLGLSITLSVLPVAVLANALPRQSAAHKRNGMPHVGGDPDWNRGNPGWDSPWMANNPWGNDVNSNNNYYGEQGQAQYRAQAIKDAFQFAWDGYYKYAFPHDELHPVTNGYGDSRNGWGASAIDALSTAIVMENAVVVNEILAFVPTIDFSKSAKNEAVSLFETTIRYIAGMLSGYDFLTGPMAGLVNDTNKNNIQALLDQARLLADELSYAFDTPTGIPSNNLYLNNHSTDGSLTNGLATIGSLVLEWTHLSDLTGDPKYAQLSQKAESYLLNPMPLSNEPWPGLVGTYVGIDNGSFVDADGGWQGGDDSFYEYLIKMYVYDTTRFAAYRDRWILAADSQKTINESEHLACFDGGNFLLAGNVLKRQDYINFGLALTSACHDTYISTATGIGPEVFQWNTSTLPSNQTAFYEKAGFWISDASYDLRPEVIESYYYAYQITKNPIYQDWAWAAFTAINASTRTESGFSAISNVNVPGGGNKTDLQESFLFAEVMKYSYLIQAPQAPWDVNYNGTNQWVFNTEAHPMKIAGPAV